MRYASPGQTATERCVGAHRLHLVKHLEVLTREQSSVLRVMPSDNSCLFTAFGGAVQENHSAQDLRRMMADYISKNSHVYTEAVLGSPPSQYCRSIQDPDRWGGGIELSILSDIFNIQICTYDVQVSRCPTP